MALAAILLAVVAPRSGRRAADVTATCQLITAAM